MSRFWNGWLFAFLVLWAVTAANTSCTPKNQSESPRTEVAVDANEPTPDSAQPEPSQPERKPEASVEKMAEKPPEPPASACKQGGSVRPTVQFMKDISRQSGIQDQGFLRTFTKKVPINDHSRLGFADINGDGYDDIIAHSLFPNPQAGIPFEHLVFLNNGDGTFRNFSDESGLRKVQGGFFLFGDVDNDGDQDCFVGLDIPLGSHSNAIYLNDGKGRFTRKVNAGVEAGVKRAANALFADFNGDGKLDLFVGNGGTSAGVPDALYFGNGDGTFTFQANKLPNNQPMASNGSVTCDFDNDGDLDIFVSVYGVSNRLGANVLWENDGKGNFKNVARVKGFESLPGGNYFLKATNYGATPEPGKQPGQYVGSNGFGIDCKDVNNDGNYDIFLTAISHPNVGTYSRKWSDPTQLLINLGSAKQFAFQNEFLKRKLYFNEGDVDGALHDFDNDGRLDLSISRDNKYERAYNSISQKAWFALFRQKADGTFQPLGPNSGVNGLKPKNSTKFDPCDAGQTCPTGETCLLKRCRKACTKDSECTQDEFCGSFWSGGKVVRFCRSDVKMKGAQNHAWADIDRDGDLDLLVGGRDKGGGRPNFLFRNEIGSKNRWLALRLVGDGKKINRDAIGARVMLVFKDNTMSREVQSSRGMYNSIDTRVLHFGLGDFPCDYEVKVRWPNGDVVTLPKNKIAENKYTTIIFPNTIQ